MVITLFDSGALSDLRAWSDEFGINHPVVADPTMAEGVKYNPDRIIPSMTLLGPGMEILIRDEVLTEPDIIPYL